jgi:hypothetical protein
MYTSIFVPSFVTPTCISVVPLLFPLNHADYSRDIRFAFPPLHYILNLSSSMQSFVSSINVLILCRLMSDDSPRSREALRSMLFGAGASSGGGLLSPDKFLEMSSQFAKSTAATADTDLQGQGMKAAQVRGVCLFVCVLNQGRNSWVSLVLYLSQ